MIDGLDLLGNSEHAPLVVPEQHAPAKGHQIDIAAEDQPASFDQHVEEQPIVVVEDGVLRCRLTMQQALKMLGLMCIGAGGVLAMAKIDHDHTASGCSAYGCDVKEQILEGFVLALAYVGQLALGRCARASLPAHLHLQPLHARAIASRTGR